MEAEAKYKAELARMREDGGRRRREEEEDLRRMMEEEEQAGRNEWIFMGVAFART
jgi:hypothetical protein